MPSLHDTRLLSNLLKTEKDAVQAFVPSLLFRRFLDWPTSVLRTQVQALHPYRLFGWCSTERLERRWFGGHGRHHGSSFPPFSLFLFKPTLTNSPTTQDAALRISHLLSSCTDAQRSYLLALTSYRASLKDVLARETALRTVVRDREILVNRLIKIGNKRPKDSGVEEHLRKVEEAQRELRACESTFLPFLSLYFISFFFTLLASPSSANPSLPLTRSLPPRRRTLPRRCQAPFVPRLTRFEDEEYGRTREGDGGELEGGGRYSGRVGSGGVWRCVLASFLSSFPFFL
jgi:hypothetical protein